MLGCNSPRTMGEAVRFRLGGMRKGESGVFGSAYHQAALDAVVGNLGRKEREEGPRGRMPEVLEFVQGPVGYEGIMEYVTRRKWRVEIEWGAGGEITVTRLA